MVLNTEIILYIYNFVVELLTYLTASEIHPVVSAVI